MDNREIIIKTIKALKENNRLELERLAIENFELVTFLIDNEDKIMLDEYKAGSLLDRRFITAIRIIINDKIKDLRNNTVKELNKYLNNWNRYNKIFILSNVKYKE